MTNRELSCAFGQVFACSEFWAALVPMAGMFLLVIFALIYMRRIR